MIDKNRQKFSAAPPLCRKENLREKLPVKFEDNIR